MYIYDITFAPFCCNSCTCMHHISIDDIHYHCQHHHVVHGEGLGNPPSLAWSGRSGRPTTDVAAWLTEESP